MQYAAAASVPTRADRDWFASRFEELLPELYGTAVRLCRDRTDAEDLVAEAVAKAWQALPALEQRAAFRGWLFRILYNTFVTQCRKARAAPAHEPVDTIDEPSFSLFERLHQPILLWWGNPELDFLNRLLREDLQRAIDELPDAFRAAVIMVDAHGLSYQEAADILDVPIGTIRSRLARGRSLLQQKLWEHAVDAGLTVDARPRPGEPT
jgi:RNA polymerase sigma-70 factor, ECF subfamily